MRYLVSLYIIFLFLGSVKAQNDTLFVVSEKGLTAFPEALLSHTDQQGDWIQLTDIHGQTYTFDHASVTRNLSVEHPTLSQFKFNNKYNDQVFSDVVCSIDGDSLVTATVPAIGKWLNASFSLSQPDAMLYADTIPLRSHRSPLLYSDDVHLTAALPNHFVLRETDASKPCELWPYGREYTVRLDFPADRAKQVPRIDINTENGQLPASKSDWLDAVMTIDGAGVYPSLEATAVKIRGRGNASWSSDASAKNPYRLKFAEKQKPFGLTAGKNWVLLANSMEGSMMANAVGMKVAALVQTAAYNHIVPVELYMNGSYRGSYNFTEKVKLANNSIALDDDSHAVLLELDNYFDEDYKFISSLFCLPVNIKAPDFQETDALTMEQVEADLNRMLQALNRGEDVDAYADVDMLARYFMVNELIGNMELWHPKSTFLYKADLTDSNNKWIFGPVWDLDWAFGYNFDFRYCTYDPRFDYWTSALLWGGGLFMSTLRKAGEPLDRAIYKTWTRFMQKQLPQLLEYIDAYYAYANPSFVHNSGLWDDGNNYQLFVKRAKTWIENRANHIYSRLNTYPLTDEELDDWLTNTDGIVILSSPHEAESQSVFAVHDIRGRLVKRNATAANWRQGLAPGIYLIKGRKVLVR